MRFFLDTASPAEIEKWDEFGVVQGVTTNPFLLSQEKADAHAQLKQIVDRVKGPVSAQVTHTNAESMVKQGLALRELGENVVVKLPSNIEGIKAAQTLVAKDVNVNITLAFDSAQLVLFSQIPATYISLILGKVEDFGKSNIAEISNSRQILDNLHSHSQLLVASIRNSGHLIAAINGGADVITVPPSTWTAIYNNPITRALGDDFLNAWSNLDSSLRDGYHQAGE